MTWPDVFDALGVRVASREQLTSAGATGRMLTSAVAGGHLIRARRDHYVLAGTNRNIIEAVRVGGRLACLSALAEAGSSRSRTPSPTFICIARPPAFGTLATGSFLSTRVTETASRPTGLLSCIRIGATSTQSE